VRTLWISGTGLDEIEVAARAAGVKVQRVPRDQLDGRARTDAPQGVIATADPVREAELDAVLADERAFLVALDGVTDPGNLGAILRSAECAGVTGAVLPRHRAVHVTPAATKAAAGAIEHVPIAVVTNLARYLADVKGPDLWVYAAAAEAGATPMWEADLAGGAALVLGAEGKGLRPLVRKTCDAAVSIPLAGRVESLNVSVAAAVLLYEAARQRG
jgi:23S rRNA (guanosine2251-2'-O)-methyltransferase